MNEKRHEFLKKTWRILQPIVNLFMKIKFNTKHDDIYVDGPCIIIANHVSSWDPLLLSQSFPRMKLYYVASEHLFRLGILSKILVWLVEPLPRKKATMGTDTVMMCLRHLRAGHAVCLYAEGNSTWNGLSDKVFPATGKLVRNSGATLVTFCLEGGYLSAPRWGKGTRRGKVYGHRVGIYTPEQLKAMTPAEINDVINRDIFENAWERQKIEKIPFKGRNTARYMERAVFLCPQCSKIGGLKGKGSKVSCSCGFETTYTDLCSFDPPVPFENIYEWDKWQMEKVKKFDFVYDDILFTDDNMTLSEIGSNHAEKIIGTGTASMSKETLVCAGQNFPINEIENMSIVQASILLFYINGKYYQIRANEPRCHRKYLAVWQNIKSVS